MSEPFEFGQVHIVSYGLLRLTNDALHLLQGVEALGEKHPDRVTMPQNCDWYSLAYSSLLKNLVLDVASLLDRAKYGKDSNCNFRELKCVLENDETRKKKYHNAIDEIDDLLKKYDNVVPDTLRNKVIAHKDLDELFSGDDYPVNLIEITRFLLEGQKIISDVFKKTFGIMIEEPNLNNIKQVYEDSLTLQ